MTPAWSKREMVKSLTSRKSIYTSSPQQLFFKQIPLVLSDCLTQYFIDQERVCEEGREADTLWRRSASAPECPLTKWSGAMFTLASTPPLDVKL